MSWKIPKGWHDAILSEPSPRIGGLGPRLSAVALAVPKGARVADIGADHGHLSLGLLRSGRAPFVWAIDASEAALDGAHEALAPEVRAGRAAVVLGDGFDGAPVGAVECAALAGTGSRTAMDIIGRGLGAGHRPQHIVFQPSGGEHDVRSEMLALGYGLVAEQLVAEGQRLFVVLAFEDGAGLRELDGVTDLYVGPFIRKQEGAVLQAWLAGQAEWLLGLLQRADKGSPEVDRLRERLASIEALRDAP